MLTSGETLGKLFNFSNINFHNNAFYLAIYIGVTSMRSGTLLCLPVYPYQVGGQYIFVKKEKKEQKTGTGMHGLSRLSGQILILAQVIICGLWDQALS